MKTFLVTGASSGIGLALTHLLAARGQRVLLAVRDVSRGERARAEVLAQHPSASLEVVRVELTDLASVRALAARDLGVDVLVNNAGIAFEPKSLTAEGVLSQLGANHFGHFALTALLVPQLASRPESRIVTVASTMGGKGRFDFANLDGSRGYNSMRAYAQSKIANVLFATELDRRLRARGERIKSVLTHPGVAATAIQQRAVGPIGFVVRAFSALFGAPPAHGAQALLAAALDPTVESGDLWGPGKRVGQPPRKEKPWPTMSSSSDHEAAKLLWEKSEALTGLRLF